MSDWDLQFLGNPHEVGERRCPHLLHDLAAVHFNGDLADTEFRGGLFVQEAADDERQHVALAPCKSRQAMMQLGQFRPRRSLHAVPIDRRPNCRDQIALADRLGQEVDGAALNGAHR